MPVTTTQARDMLTYLSADCGREEWVAVGQALKSEFGDAAWELWDAWSQQSEKYDSRAARACWRSFRDRAGGIGIGTLVKLAKDSGFRFDPAQKPTADDLAALAARRAEAAGRARAEQAKRTAGAARAAELARAAWRDAATTGVSPYAERKQVARPESVRFAADGSLLIPMLRYDLPRESALRGLQSIDPAGVKRFTPGAQKGGAACRLGLVVVGQPIYICEGWATACTLREALLYKAPVFVAFDAGNMAIVAEVVYQAHPGCPVVLCADDDWQTTRRMAAGAGTELVPNNVGRIAAQEAAECLFEAGAKAVLTCFPVFSPSTPRTAKDTDFNDLRRLEGIACVRMALEMAWLGLGEILENYKQYAA